MSSIPHSALAAALFRSPLFLLETCVHHPQNADGAADFCNHNTAYRFDRRCCSLAEKSSFSFFISAAAIFNFVGTMGDTCTVVLR